MVNFLALVGTALLSEYIESSKDNAALFKFYDTYMYFEVKNDTIISYSSETTNNITKSTNIKIFKYDD